MTITLNSVYPALLNTLPSAGVTDCNVMGYYQSGDGGGGEFYWDAASTKDPDRGLVVQVYDPFGVPYPGAGRWIRRYSGGLNVKWFGATGDPLVNDTALVRNAVNAAAGRELYFPKGTYYGGAGAEILNILNGCRLVGESRESTILMGFFWLLNLLRM